MKKNIRILVIFGIVILGCALMAIVDAVIKPHYFVKSLIKIILFLVVPLIYFFSTKDDHIKKIVAFDKKGFAKSLLLGVGIYIIIIAAYFLTKNFYDYSNITGQLTNNVGVTKNNFIFVSIYISFCNSLLEEFFFRGFAFLTLSQYIGRKWAFTFSSIIFAAYHIAIMSTWFSPIIFILALVGLAIGGGIFNWLDSKNENIYRSYMVHMFANFAINTIGFILFGATG